MMPAHKALLILSIAAVLILTVQAKCSNLVPCPCGNTGKNFMACIPKGNADEEFCKKWASCKNCQDGLKRCLECPQGFGGPLCTQARGLEERKSRKKRENAARKEGTCPDLYNPKFGTMKCSYDNGQRVCKAKCLPGYSFSSTTGEYKLQCTNGQWKPLKKFPSCHSMGLCGLTLQGDGTFNCTDDKKGTHCDVYCDNNHTGRYSCNPKQTWEPKLPHCVQSKVKKTCSDPGFKVHTYRMNSDGSESDDSRTFEEGESLVFSCRSRHFLLQGSSLLLCLENGTWSDNLPSCIEANPFGPMEFCKDPEIKPNGYRDPTSAPHVQGFPPGSALQYSCKENYDIKGEKKIYCLTTGRWSSSVPRCENKPPPKVHCANPGTVHNGRFVRVPNTNMLPFPDTSSDDVQYPEGTWLQYACDNGYTLQGSPSISCRETGEWSTSPPTCKQEQGPKLANCINPGFILDGQIFIFPNADNHLRGVPPPNPSDPTFREGTVLRFVCSLGYNLQGSTSVTCEATGKWSRDIPICQKEGMSNIMCNNPGPLSNGDTELDLNSGIHPKEPPFPTKNDPAFTQGSVIRFSCKNGYILKGNVLLTCGASGKWSTDLPVCEKKEREVMCDNPGPISNGEMVLDSYFDEYLEDRPTENDPSFTQGSVMLFSCSDGFILKGNLSLICEASGKWSTNPPICEKDDVYCSNPESLPNGRIIRYSNSGNIPRESTQSPREDQSLSEGSVLEFSCSKDYILEGSATAICEASGKWSTNPPKCTRSNPQGTGKKFCPKPREIEDGTFTYEPSRNEILPEIPSDDQQYPEGAKLRYSCNHGYRQRGLPSITCKETGEWSNDPPTCIKDDLNCSKPLPLLFGKFTARFFPNNQTSHPHKFPEDVEEYPQGTVLEYDCDEDYKLKGYSKLICGRFGQWSSPPPMCISECGHSPYNERQRITFGNATSPGDWPWVVALASGEDGFIECGGAVLNENTIVTAAHCLTSANKFTLYFGIYKREDKNNLNVVVRTSDHIIRHPDFNNDTLDSDIALVKFDKEIEFSDRIQPICLTFPKKTEKNLNPGNEGYVTGWGITERRREAKELLLAHLPVLADDDCKNSYRKIMPDVPFTENMFCAGYAEGGQSACQGDSGSALVFYDEMKKKFILEGLVSFGTSDQCGTKQRFTMFTKVVNFKEWIDENLSVKT